MKDENFIEDQIVWQNLVEGLKTSAIVFGLIGLGMLIVKVFP